MGGRGDIDDVETGSGDADVFKLGEAEEGVAVEDNFIDQNDFRAVGALEDFGKAASVVNRATAERLESFPTQVAWVERIAIQNDNLCHRPSVFRYCAAAAQA